MLYLLRSQAASVLTAIGIWERRERREGGEKVGGEVGGKEGRSWGLKREDGGYLYVWRLNK